MTHTSRQDRDAVAIGRGLVVFVVLAAASGGLVALMQGLDPDASYITPVGVVLLLGAAVVTALVVRRNSR